MNGCHSFAFSMVVKMELGIEVTKIGWNLSLRAQSRRALTMKSIWLREFGEDNFGGNRKERYTQGNNMWAAEHKLGRSTFVGQAGVKLSTNPALADMKHDQENGILIGEEGKKRARGENEEDINNTMERNRKVLEVLFFICGC